MKVIKIIKKSKKSQESQGFSTYTRNSNLTSGANLYDSPDSFKKKKPPRLDGKVLRSLSDNKEFTLAKFKKRFNLE